MPTAEPATQTATTNRERNLLGEIERLRRKNADLEATVQQVGRDWQDVLNNIPDCITLHDRDFNIVWANRAAIQLLRLPMVSASGAKCHAYFHNEARCPSGCAGSKCMDSGAPAVYERYEPALQKHLEITAIPRFDARRRLMGMIHIARDVTERRELQRQLVQAQKMDAIGRVAAGVAHDFNNLLTAIAGFADVARDTTSRTDGHYECLADIKQACNRAQDLTSQLLLFSRQQTADFACVDLSLAVSRLGRVLSRLLGEDITIETFLEQQTCKITADVGNIEQVLINLAVNARDAMPDGGTLTIRTEPVLLDKIDASTHPDARPGPFVRLTVEDTGLGMDRETKERIFEPFFTTKGVGQGTGLGLAVVFGVVKQHKGWIDVFSRLGQGTRFEVYLPTSDADADNADEHSSSLRSGRGNGERILLVEDDDQVRRFAAHALRLSGYTVYEASNMARALVLACEASIPVDIVFADVVLPDGTGLELVHEISRRGQRASTLLTSGYLDQRSHWEAIRTEGWPFLRKPYSLGSLLQALQRAMAAS